MAVNNLMNDFPPARGAQVSLSNWRKAPFSQWAFRNVRRVLPTANIAGAAQPVPFESELQDVGQTRFKGADGRDTTIAAALPATSTDALVVLRRGKIAAEWYGAGMSATTPHIVFSVSKSICGTLGGILVERRELDPDHLVTEYVPELAASVYGGDCTVRHLLDMSVGISFTEDYVDPKSNVVRYRHAAGWDPLPAGEPPIDLRSFLAQQQPDGNAHGSLFHYVSTNTDVLGWVYERACDRPYADILSDYLWAPMGAEHDAYITVDSRDAMRAAGGICATPRDIARFGEMIRRRGVANGRQVVPGVWIDDINQQGDAAAWARGEFAELFPNASYRSQWYRVDRERNVLMAYGIHGQIIYINPDAETVIVRMACENTPVDADVAQSWRRGFDAIAKQFV
ncbi:serine hydrolase [Tardiphaga sp.]|uniref:serine hydrolase domain-containing protein n=1 Tax=Tardiphaga sp. TaxID=1926292 RepID=UPI00262A89AB|nr:serine hydrolase [Tardiphaga sp.]MDB5616096.1 serine hydrolase [Tardiphaga sp.]